MTQFRVQRIGDLEELQRCTAEWERLDEFSSPRTPFTGPLWNLLWWRHFAEDRFLAKDELFVLAVRDAEDRLVALAPLTRTVRPAHGPLRMREIQFFGAGTDLLEFRSMVSMPAHRDEATRIIHEYLMAHATEWDTLLWCGVQAGESIESLGSPPSYREVTDYYLELPASWTELKTSLSRNMKEALRKCYNSLAREGHKFQFSAVSDPAEVDAALKILFDLHRARARLKGRVPHPDRFGPERSRRFIRDYAHRMAERDQLRIFQLTINQQVVATRIAFVLGNEIYMYYSGYAPEWARFSVMTTLAVESIKWAMERQFRIMNLSSGRDYAKARWRPSERATHDFLVWSQAVQASLVQSKLFGLLRYAPPQSLLGKMVGIARRAQ